MLKKLLKYELIYIYKLLGFLYLLTIVLAGFTRLLFELDQSTIINLIIQISSAVTIVLMFTIMINTLTRIWMRFVKNMYGDESYLTHTLPIPKKDLYLAKFLSAIITMFTSVLVVLVSLAILFYSKENINSIKTMLEATSTVYNSTIIGLLLGFFFIFFLEMTLLLLVGYTGIILGHVSNYNRITKSFLFGFVCYMGSQVGVIIALLLVALCNPNLMKLFTSSTVDNLSLMKTVLFIALVVYLILNIVFYLVDRKVLDKGVNID